MHAYAMVCKKVATMTQMRHDSLVKALRLITHTSLQSVLEPRDEQGTIHVISRENFIARYR